MRNRLFIIISFLALSLCCEAQNTTVAGPPKKKKTHDTTVTNSSKKKKSNMATLFIDCKTHEVEIYVNGTRKGTRQWHGRLAPGTYQVEAHLAGYQSYSTSVTLVEGDGRLVDIPTLKALYGSLNVSYDAGAKVLLDGKELLGTSPKIFNNVSVGAHSLLIMKDGYESKTLDVDVVGDEIVDVQGSLTPLSTQSSNTAVSQVASIPSGTIKTFTVNGVSFDMVFVEGGTFMMGNKLDYEDRKQRQITLTDYYIGKTEVTQALWQAVMGSNPSWYKGKKRPVDSVSWNDCQEFINKLNSLTGETFSLPTEAQWEFAARGGNKNKGYMYSGSNNIDDVAWYTNNSHKYGHATKSHDVGTKQPNELGAYDMSGNIEEWCSDWYAENYNFSAQTNPTGPSMGKKRVCRGGDHFSEENACTVVWRFYESPLWTGGYLGLRLALSK